MTYTAPTLQDGEPYPAAMWQELMDEVAALSAVVNSPSVMASDSAGGTCTSTAYSSTLGGVTTPLTLVFTAAKTSADITVSAMITQQTSGPWNQYMTPAVTGDDYSYGPNDDDAAIGQWTSDNVGAMISRTTTVTGLTAGNTYTVTPQFKGSGVQCTFSYRRVLVHL